MNAHILSRWISGCLSLALLFQLGTVRGFAADQEDTAEEPQRMEQMDHQETVRLERGAAQNKNPVTHYVNQFDGEEKEIIWVQGIQPPSIGDPDSDLKPVRETDGDKVFETYRTPYISDHGWYDVNKSKGEDTYLCFAVAATNSLHWWLEQNDPYIQKYLKKNPDQKKMALLEQKYLNSFRGQTDSGLFDYFKETFANRPNGYWPNFLQDYFLNGYPYKSGPVNIPGQDVNFPGQDRPAPKPNNGFFYDVFGDELLSGRYQAGTYENASKLIKQLLLEGNVVMPTFEVGQNSHIVTLWGAEYDMDGNISAMFLSDSDDGDVTQTNQAMRRVRVVKHSNGRAKLTTHADGGGGNFLWSLNTLSLGEKGWEEYFSTKPQLDVEWGNSQFDYDKTPHKPEILKVSGADPADEVRVVSTGEETNAGAYNATAVLEGADAAKYIIPLEQKTKRFTIAQATPNVTLTADLKNYATDGSIVLKMDVAGVKGEKPEGTITLYEGGREIHTVSTLGGEAIHTWKNPGPGPHQITAQFRPDQFGLSKNYTSSQSVPLTIDPDKQEQDPLVFGPIDGKRFGDADFPLSVTGGSTQGAVEYISSNPDVITIDGDMASIKGAGTTKLTATKAGDDTYGSVSKTIEVRVAKGAAPQITYPTASELTYGQTLAESRLTGGNERFGTFAWEHPTTVPDVGGAQYRVLFTPSAATEQNYEPISPLRQEVSVTVHPAAPTVTLKTEVQQNGAEPMVVLTAAVEQVGAGKVPSGTVKFLNCTDGTPEVLPGAEAVRLQNGIATFTWTGMKPGQYRVQAQFSGNTNYTEALSAEEPVDPTAPVEKTYPIHVESNGNGTVRSSHTSASKGTQVTLTPVPDQGYRFQAWKVLAGNVTLSGNSFTMPEMAVSIQAIFEKQSDSSGGGSGGGGSSGGGGGSSSGSSTKPGGSPTNTVTKPDGTVVQETKKPDGTNVVEMTQKDGTISVTEQRPSGSTETKVTLPEKVTQAANRKGETIALPMPPVTVQTEAGKTPVVKVDLGTAQSAKVSLPVDHMKPGVVAIAVQPDGTKQVVRKSVVTESGMVLTLDGSTTLELEDRSKDFQDTRAHWAKDAIAFVSSREIFRGTTDHTFSPNAGITRGMLVKVLHNLEGNPQQGESVSFSDVAPDAWFTESVQWAVDNGIVKGFSDHRFAPGQQITREEIAVMLYRYAGSPDPKGTTLSFQDADQVGAYAAPAITWAVEQGILTGVDAQTLNPKGTATRAQAAVMMMRLMNTMLG